MPAFLYAVLCDFLRGIRNFYKKYHARNNKMSQIDIDIKNIKNIRSMNTSFPLEKGLYALVGENGCGKSTIMLALSLIVKTSSSHMLKPYDISSDSSIRIQIDETEDLWFNKKGKLTTGKFGRAHKNKMGKPHTALIASTHMDGFYEGSIFYGCRFDDYNVIDQFMSIPEMVSVLVDADDFVKETLGFILHNDKDYYPNLKKIKSRTVAMEKGFNGMPYFNQINGHIISQYRMSSGESMLISLIDFINNLVIKNSRRSHDILFLIDEVELALHPSAIDRLVLFLKDLTASSTSNLIIYFSTHSSELIHRISPKNIFYVENNNGIVEITNPCYPNYAVRNLYIPNGFDFLLLVEDELAKALVEKVIREYNLSKSKLCCVLPSGGWAQMLKLHYDMVTYNTLGVGKHIISIFDGDAKEEVAKHKEYNALPKSFLPIPSIEKYLRKKCILDKDQVFIKLINDKYFRIRSLKDIIHDYMNDPRTKRGLDNDGKSFYKVIIANLERSGINEQSFINYLCDDICSYENISGFVESMKKHLN